METSSYWLVFLAAAFAINVSPGPDIFYVLSKTIAQGRKIGFASSLGVCSGAMVHVLAAALGLSAILATSALAFNVVKYIGAAYLFYLGIQSLMSKGLSFKVPAKNGAATSAWKAFQQGVFIDLLNPKAAMFFMAFLPQFVRPELGHNSVQIFVLGFLVILLAIPIEFAVVLTASQTTNFIRNNQKVSVWLDRLLGSVLIGLGIRLALTEHHTA